MAEGIRIGNLYYSVGIDRQTLRQAQQAVREIGNTARTTSQQQKGLTEGFKRTRDEVRILVNRLGTLRRQYTSGKIGPEQYTAALQRMNAEQQRLTGELEQYRGEMSKTSAGMAQFTGQQRTLATAQNTVVTEQNKLTASSKQASGAVGALGGDFDELIARARALGVSVRNLDQEQRANLITADQYNQRARQLQRSLRENREQMMSFADSAARSTGTQRLHQQAIASNTRALSSLTRSTTRAEGALNKMQLQSALSRGGLSLLNDRIFQISPALGIFTNQLMFATEGLRAFVMAAAPVVAAAGAVLGVLGGLVASIRAGTGLESALADVRKTTGLAADELRDLTDAFFEISEQIPVSTDELLEIAQVAGQLGIRGTENIEEFTEAIANLGVATDITGREGATSLARFLNALGTPLRNMGREANRVGNVLNELGNTMAATAGEILQMTGYTQGLSSQADFTAEEILALNAALLSLGVRAEAGGSAVVRSVGKIQDAAVQGGEALELFAWYSNRSTEAFRTLAEDSPIEAFTALVEGLNRASEEGESLNAVLNELGINEVRERRALLALAQGSETFAEAIAVANREAIRQTSLMQEVEIQSDRVAARIQMLGNRFSNMAKSVGRNLTPTLNVLLDILIWMVDNLPIVAGGVISLTGAILGLDRVVKILTVSLTALRTVLTFLTGPAGLIVGFGIALGSAVNFLRNYSDEVEDTTENALARFNEELGEASEHLRDVSNTDEFVRGLEKISDHLEGPGLDAWNEYLRKIKETKDEIEDLPEATDKALIQVAESKLISVEAQVDAAGASARGYVEDILGASSRGQQMPLTDAELRSLISAVSAGPAAMDRAIEQIENRITEDPDQNLSTAIGGFSAEVALTNIREYAQDWRQVAREAEGIRDEIDRLQGVADGDRERTPRDPDGGPTRTPGEVPDPVGDILLSFNVRKKELETSLEELSDFTQRHFSEGMVSAAERGIDGLINVIARANAEGNPLAVEIREAVGRDDEGNFFMSMEEAKRQADELAQVAADRIRTVMLAEARQHGSLLVEMDSTPIPSPRTGARGFDPGGQGAPGMPEGPMVERVQAAREAWEDYADAISLVHRRQDAGQFETQVEFVEAQKSEVDNLIDSLLRLGYQADEGALPGLLDTQEALANALERLTAEFVEFEDSLTKGENRIRRSSIATFEWAESVRDARDAFRDQEDQIDELLDRGLVSHEEAYEQRRQLLRNHVIEMAELEGWDAPHVQAMLERLKTMPELLQDSLSEEQEQILKYHNDAEEAERAHRQALQDIREDYHESVMDAERRFRLGLINHAELLEEQLAAAEQKLFDMAKTTGEEVTPEMIRLQQVIEALRTALANLRDETEDTIDDGESTFFGDLSEVLGGMSFEGIGGDLLDFTQSFVDGLDEVIRGLNEMGESAEENSKMVLAGFGAMARGIANAVGSIESDVGQAVSAIGGIAGGIAEVASGIPGLGAIISGLIDAIVSMFENMFYSLQREISRFVEEASDGVRYLTEDSLQRIAEDNTQIVHRFWTGVRAEIDKEAANMVADLADTVAGGLADAMRQGVRGAMVDDADWKQDLSDGFKTAMMNMIIDTFIQTAIVKGLMQHFFTDFAALIAKGQYEEAMQLADDVLPALLDHAERMIDEFVDIIPDELMTSDELEQREENQRSTAGARIGQITGPSRDLLTDLLRPLSVMPTWNKWIRDIRNDVRTIAMRDPSGGGGTTSPSGVASGGFGRFTGIAGTTVNRSIVGTVVGTGGTNITLNNVTITTNASNIKELTRSISKYTFKEGRGGK